jgi:hypothetical protein
VFRYGNCIRACVRVHARTRTHARMRTRTRTRAHTRAHARTHARARARTRTRAHAHTRTRAHAHTRTRAHAHTRTRAPARTHTRAHAHAHTRARVRAREGFPTRGGVELHVLTRIFRENRLMCFTWNVSIGAIGATFCTWHLWQVAWWFLGFRGVVFGDYSPNLRVGE